MHLLHQTQKLPRQHHPPRRKISRPPPSCQLPDPHHRRRNFRPKTCRFPNRRHPGLLPRVLPRWRSVGCILQSISLYPPSTQPIYPCLPFLTPISNPRFQFGHTFDPRLIARLIPHQHSRSLSIQWIARIWITEQLWQKDFENVDHVEHWGPSLVDDVETYRSAPTPKRHVSFMPSFVASSSSSFFSSIQLGIGLIWVIWRGAHISSMLGWKMRLTKPIEGDL